MPKLPEVQTFGTTHTQLLSRYGYLPGEKAVWRYEACVTVRENDELQLYIRQRPNTAGVTGVPSSSRAAFPSPSGVGHPYTYLLLHASRAAEVR